MSAPVDPPQQSWAPPGWYPDPWQLAVWRWFDGMQWAAAVSNDAHPFGTRTSPWVKIWPTSRPQWVVFLVAGLIGLAIWIPTMAAQPRYSHGPQEANGSAWGPPLVLGAALLLGALAFRHWSVVASGLLAPQFLLAPFTTPRGDDDGLWVLIFVGLAVIFVLAHVLAGVTAEVVTRLDARRRNAQHLT